MWHCEVAGSRIPIPWYQSLDPLFSIVAVPVLFWIWRQQASRRRRARRPREDRHWRVARGGEQPGPRPGEPCRGLGARTPVWPFLYCAGLGIAFLYYWPTLLALVSRARRRRSTPR